MAKISYSELKRGVRVIINGEPYEIMDSAPLFKGRGHSVLQTRLKNLRSGNLISRTFHPSDQFEEAEVEKIPSLFLYSHRGKYFFAQKNNPSKRFDLTEEQLGGKGNFLKPKEEVAALLFKDEIINISLPIKVRLKVKEAPPGIKGERAQAGTKVVTLETGAKVNVPLFVKEGDIVEINTETGEYTRRVN